MKRLAALGFAVALAACGPSPAARTAPVEDADRFVSDEGSFSAVYPAAPEASSKEVDTGVGIITLRTVGVAVLREGAMGAFTVTWADLPPGLEHRMVDTARAAMRKPPRVFLSEREVEIVPGLVKGWEIQYEEGILEKTGRVFEVGRRYYQVLVEYPKGQRPPGMRRFFDTFRLK